MNPILRILLITLLSTSILSLTSTSAFAQEEQSEGTKTQKRDRDFDEPGEDENLNRELWEYVRKTPYSDVLRYVATRQRDSRSRQTNEVTLPNGWRMSPAGGQVEVGRLPYTAVLFAGRLVVLDTGYYYQEPQEVSIVDTDKGHVVKTLKLKSLFPSAEVGLDGDLYVSGGFEGKVFRINRNFEVVREYVVGGFSGGLAAIDDKHLVVGYLAIKNEKGAFVNGRVAILNTETGGLEDETDTGYFPYAVRRLKNKFYVTLLGENKLLIYNKDLKLIETVGVGRTPQEMCADGRHLYVVNSTSDSLSVVDLQSSRLLWTINVALAGSRFGRSPTSCAIDRNRLYVTLADVNAVAILDRRTGRQLGLIPTGWYPTKILFGKNRVFVLNAKGIRARRPNPQGPQPINSRIGEYVLTLLKGTVSIIPRSEIPRKLNAWTRQVQTASPLFNPNQGFKLPIRHVFYVIKENRSYDQILGDLGRGNGDPALTLFGKEITPIQHQLANEFVTLDNFFVNGEISVLGHSFTTSGYASPFLEWLGNVAYSFRWTGYPFGTVPAVTSPTYLWDALDEKNVDYRIYGENYFLFTRAYRILVDSYGSESLLAKRFYDKTINAAWVVDRGNEFYQLARPYYGRADTREAAYALLGDRTFARSLSQFLTGDDSVVLALQKDTKLRSKFADYLYHYPFNYRSWDLRYSDLDRAQAWITDFKAQLKLGKVPAFHYIWLPNDHTDGAREEIHNAYQFVAQNDAALGRIIETISHSPIWKESLILVVEDDAQNGPDHVDATRTVAFAIGPHVKRGAVISDRYDQLSMLRTIELLLGLNPMTVGDRLAVPMFGIFTEKPDLEPFVPTEPSQRLVPEDRERYKELAGPMN